MISLFASTKSRGGTPFLSASYVIGVPCSSVPLAISTRDPRKRSKRASTSAGTANPARWPMCRGPFAYGQAGATKTVLGTGDDKRKLAARPLTEGFDHLRRGAAYHLLMNLRELAGQCQHSIRQRLGDHRQRFMDAKRRLESDSRSRIVAKRGQQTPHLARLAGEVAREG